MLFYTRHQLALQANIQRAAEKMWAEKQEGKGRGYLYDIVVLKIAGVWRKLNTPWGLGGKCGMIFF